MSSGGRTHLTRGLARLWYFWWINHDPTKPKPKQKPKINRVIALVCIAWACYLIGRELAR